MMIDPETFGGLVAVALAGAVIGEYFSATNSLRRIAAALEKGQPPPAVAVESVARLACAAPSSAAAERAATFRSVDRENPPAMSDEDRARAEAEIERATAALLSGVAGAS